MPTILVIDDNRAIGQALSVLFDLHGLKTTFAASPAEGLKVLRHQSIDLVVQDMNFTGSDTTGSEGVKLFDEIRKRFPDLPIILLTAWTRLEDAVELVKAGAADYLAKPWDDTKLIVTVMNLLRLGELQRERRRLVDERRQARETLAERFDLCGIIYESTAMQEILSIVTQIAHADVPVLISGPSGVGKEKVADIICANSTSGDKPYLKVNMGALPTELIESELFGAEAGAFTGIQKSRAGRFEVVEDGTLFLDEIGVLPPTGQAKLLRVLQTGEFERLGSTQTRRVRARILAATNTDLRAAIAAGSFREDLYYRLNVIEIRIPPLAERREDILPLARHFLGDRHQLTQEAASLLLAHEWPGNVRELHNCMRRAVLLAKNETITPEVLQLAPLHQPQAIPNGALSKEEIEAALVRHSGVIAAAAQELGLSRQALYRRMEKFGISKA